MRTHGKKIGKYEHKTVLGLYKLDVRVDVAEDKFVVLVPPSPAAKVDLKGTNYDVFEAPTLAEVKEKVAVFLRDRDTTPFVDVIEYSLDEARTHYLGMRDDGDPYPCKAAIDFKFRVARVSEAKTRERPTQEIPVEVDEKGNVVASTYRDSDEFMGPRQYSYGYDYSAPFTPELLHQCREAVRQIRVLKGNLHASFRNENVPSDEEE